MMRAEDIRDEVSFEAWLEGQLRKDGIAARSAARVMPFWAAYCLSVSVAERTFNTIPILRENLISLVATVSPTLELFHMAAAAIDSDVALAAAEAHYAAAANSASAASAAAADRTFIAVAYAGHAAANAIVGVTDNATVRATSDAVASIWDAIRKDARAIESGETCLSLPLWPHKNPLSDVWAWVKRDWSQPNSPYAFWLRWYESLLAGEPMNSDLLYQIALIPDDIWDAGAEAVAKEIARIEAEFAKGEEDLVRSLASMPPAQPDRVQATKQAMERHRADLPPTFDAILGYIALEIERLQTRNYRNADDEEEAKRQIRTLTTLYRAVEELQALVPTTETMPVEDAEKAEKLGRLYLNKIKEWPRENADEMVDNTYRFALVGLTTLALPMIGLSTIHAFAGGMVFFGGKKLLDAAKIAKDLMKPS